MSHTYRLCSGCARHVRRIDARCPFCAAELDALAPESPAFRLVDVSRIALALAMVAGCERPAASSSSAPPAAAPDHAAIAPSEPPSTADVAVEPVDAAADALAALLLHEPVMLGLAYGAPAMLGTNERQLPSSVVLESVAIEPADVDPMLEQRVLRAHLGGVRMCYERVLRQNPTIAGVLQIRYAIDANGRVPTQPTPVQGIDPAVDACVGARLRMTAHPPAVAAHRVTARFRMRPAE